MNKANQEQLPSELWAGYKGMERSGKGSHLERKEPTYGGTSRQAFAY